ncbi:MAG: flippase-like domain-containing protein [Deltaproteobacteria bacterium]|nr:flippase-like domain-containing protein [Candidatus Anaeroferrophillus wilburensis]MBN2889503.1 flippase-like domain-containing protein [Deltaproteobacteria bacterium]
MVAFYNRKALLRVMGQAELPWIGAGLGCYFFNYATRAYRLRMLSGDQVPFYPAAIKSSCLHGFYSYFLPLRSGDLSLPLLLRCNAQLPLLLGSGILLRARLLDFFSLGLLLSAASLLSAPQLQAYVRYLFFFSGIGLLLLPYGILFLLHAGNNRLQRTLNNRLAGMKVSYFVTREVLVSLLIWFWTGCTIFSVIQSLSIPLAFMDVWFLAAIQLPLQLFPLQGLANAGNHEAGWLAALSMLGIAPAQGLPLTMASHVILISYVAILGSLALMLRSPEPAEGDVACDI